MLCFQSPPSSVSQKSWYMNPLQVPQQGPLWRELPISTAFFYMSLEFLNKSSNGEVNSVRTHNYKCRLDGGIY